MNKEQVIKDAQRLEVLLAQTENVRRMLNTQSLKVFDNMANGYTVPFEHPSKWVENFVKLQKRSAKWAAEVGNKERK